MSTESHLYLITGATGNTGDTTVRLLLQRGHRVRAFVHSLDARSESLAAARRRDRRRRPTRLQRPQCGDDRSRRFLLLLPDRPRTARSHRVLRTGCRRRRREVRGQHVSDLGP